MTHERPKVGVGVFVYRDGKVLMGLRHGAHSPGTWALVGGHVEYGESFVQAAKREVLEETGMRISEPVVVAVTNNVFEVEGVQYVTVAMKANWLEGEPELKEPTLTERWEWINPTDLPTPLFLPLAHMLAAGVEVATPPL